MNRVRLQRSFAAFRGQEFGRGRSTPKARAWLRSACDASCDPTCHTEGESCLGVECVVADPGFQVSAARFRWSRFRKQPTLAASQTMITRIEIKGFKAFGAPQTASLAPITLIYGTNSSGKSALLQSLLFLKQSDKVGRPLYKGPDVDLASAQHVAFRHQESLRSSVAIAFRSGQTDVVVGLHLGTAPNTVELTVKIDGEEELRVKGNGVLPDKAAQAAFLSFVRSAHPEWSTDQWSFWVDAVNFVADSLFQPGGNRLVPTIECDFGVLRRMWEDQRDPDLADVNVDQRLAKLTKRDLEVLIQGIERCQKDVAESWDGPISTAFATQLRRIRHLGPVRPAPVRQHPEPVRQHPEADGAGASTLQSIKPESRQHLATWCSYLELPYQFTADTLGDAASGVSTVTRVTDLRNGLTLALTDVGYGVSQVLPLLLEGLPQLGGWGGTKLVEQPELHLHPRQQGHLADFLLWSSGLCDDFGKSISIPKHKYPVQWILETHSEALVSRIQRRVRQGLVDPTQVSVVFVEPGPEGSRLIPLRLNASGEFIDEWPGGFFEETYWDLFGGIQ